VAVIFAREITPPLTSLVKKLDEATLQNADHKMGSFVVLLTDKEEAGVKRLKELAQKEGLTNIILTTYGKDGPPSYDINKDADVTVLFYVQKTVKANYAYRKGDFRDKDIDAVLEGLPKIVSK
jgi:hypothetical protein